MSAAEGAALGALALAVIALIVGVHRRRTGTFRMTFTLEREHRDEDATRRRDES